MQSLQLLVAKDRTHRSLQKNHPFIKVKYVQLLSHFLTTFIIKPSSLPIALTPEQINHHIYQMQQKI